MNYLHACLHTISSCELVDEGVERQRAGDGHGGHDLGRGDEGVRGRVAVVALSEVAGNTSDNKGGLVKCLSIGQYGSVKHRPI